MKLEELKKILFSVIENRERSCVYEILSTEKECVFSAFLGDSTFLIKCCETKSDDNNILR